MAEVIRYDVPWSIPNAGPSVNVFHFAGGSTQTAIQGSVNALRTFYSTLANRLPNDIVIGFSASYSVLDVSTGQLVGVGSVDQPTNVPGTNAGNWAAGAGARVQWHTDVVRNGRKVVGSTFLVPLATPVFDNNGQIIAADRASFALRATELMETCQVNAPLAVFTRPAPAKQGAATAVVRATVPAVAATLRKRKY